METSLCALQACPRLLSWPWDLVAVTGLGGLRVLLPRGPKIFGCHQLTETVLPWAEVLQCRKQQRKALLAHKMLANSFVIQNLLPRRQGRSSSLFTYHALHPVHSGAPPPKRAKPLHGVCAILEDPL